MDRSRPLAAIRVCINRPKSRLPEGVTERVNLRDVGARVQEAGPEYFLDLLRGYHERHAAFTPAISNMKSRLSFDDFVGAGEDRRRDGYAQRLGGLQIDGELVVRWSFDRQLCR